MSSAEQEVLSAVYELGSGYPTLISYDRLAARLATTITAVKTVAFILQNRNLAVATFGGIQLTSQGMDQARHEHQLYAD